MVRTRHPYVDARFERQLELVRPSLERVEVAPVPAGYVLRVFRDDDEPRYLALFQLAWPDKGTLAHTRAHALSGGFFVVEHGETEQLVGSCVAFEPETPSHPADGSLGWLVVDPAHTRRGLGKLLAAAVTNRLLREHYALPWLGTEDERVPAIGLYLGLGWQPHLYTPEMHGRWRAIFERLRIAGP